MTREATKGTQSEHRTCLDFTQADDGSENRISRASAEKRIGAEFLEPEKQVSGLELPEQADEQAEKD